jgi:hypothetical protein
LIGTVSEFVLGVDITDTESLKMPENPLTDFNNDVWSNYNGWYVSPFCFVQNFENYLK